MSYIVPSVQVYQQLKNSGGVANSTPDLDVCILGPAYNVVKFDGADPVSVSKTAAASAVTTTGSITKDTKSLVVASAADFYVGDSVLVAGAGSGGAQLRAIIASISGLTLTLATAASTTVTNASVVKAAKLSNTLSNNVYALPYTKAGQEVESDSVKVFLRNAEVSTLKQAGELVTSGLGALDTNSLTVFNVNCTEAVSVVQQFNGLQTSDVNKFYVGQAVYAYGSLGTAVTTVTGFLLDNDYSYVVVDTTPLATVGTVTSIKPVYSSNTNPLTGALRVESGDAIRYSYLAQVNLLPTVVTKTTYVRDVTTSQGVAGTFDTITTFDNIAPDFYVGYMPNGSNVINSAAVTITGDVSVSHPWLVANIKVLASNGTNTFVTRVTSVTPGATSTINLAKEFTAAGSGVTTLTLIPEVHFEVVKKYEYIELPKTDPLTGANNFTVSALEEEVTVLPTPFTAAGEILSGDVHLQYRALRKDLSNALSTFDTMDDIDASLEVTTDENPLGLACMLAKAATTGRVTAFATAGTDLEAFVDVLDLLEDQRVYALVPLTQEQSILAAFKAHVESMSLPENHAWRVVICNTAIPTSITLGDEHTLELGSEIDLGGGVYGTPNTTGKGFSLAPGTTFYFDGPEDSFVSNGVGSGDILNYQDPDGKWYTSVVDEVVSNTRLIVKTYALGGNGVQAYYVSRILSKAAQAEAVAKVSATFGSNRVWHVMPDKVVVEIDGVDKTLPGYYLTSVIGGLTSGIPIQMNLTNIGIPGIKNLKNSNFYFSRRNLATMAEAGTMIAVQETQDGIPYVRHGLTTDMTVLEYREALKVKNWDFLAYFYYDKIKGFIGTWNITEDTLNIIRQTLEASSQLLMQKKLAKIGAPLMGYNITKLAQNAVNKDNIDAYLSISMVDPNNYTNLYLVV